MSYSQFYFKRGVKIPSFIGILAVFFMVFIVGQYVLTTASPTRGVKRTVKSRTLTNLAPTQVTLFWQTEDATTGWILYGENVNRLTTIAQDERDSSAVKQSYKNHYATLKNLKADTTYYYKFVVQNEIVTSNGNIPFEFKTLPGSIQAATARPAYGKVLNKSEQPVKNAVVILTAQDSYPLSALSKSSGEWLIPLNYVIDKKTNSPKFFKDTDVIRFDIVSEEDEKSIIRTTVANTSPFPETILVGQDYDFTQEEQVLSVQSASKIKEYKIEIVYPKRGATIPATSPLIKGTALPGRDVNVAIGRAGQTTAARVKTDSSGQWRFIPAKKLLAGEYTITIETANNKNEAVQKAQGFVIAKSGEQVLAEATSSATTTPSPTLTQTLSPTVTPAILSLTLSPTTPVSGISLTPYAATSISLIILGIGLLLVF